MSWFEHTILWLRLTKRFLWAPCSLVMYPPRVPGVSRHKSLSIQDTLNTPHHPPRNNPPNVTVSSPWSLVFMRHCVTLSWLWRSPSPRVPHTSLKSFTFIHLNLSSFHWKTVQGSTYILHRVLLWTNLNEIQVKWETLCVPTWWKLF